LNSIYGLKIGYGLSFLIGIILSIDERNIRGWVAGFDLEIFWGCEYRGERCLIDRDADIIAG
jgi:hypothetical protein